MNARARNALMCDISKEKYAKVLALKYVKIMYETLIVNMKCLKRVKRN